LETCIGALNSRERQSATITYSRLDGGPLGAQSCVRPGIKARFHDLRHTAVTMMAEKGLPDLTIMAQFGHVSPAMMKTYSHIRRQALNQAAAALEPNFTKTPAVAELVD